MSRRPPSFSLKSTLLPIILLLAVLVPFSLYSIFTRPVNSSDNTQVKFSIDPGESVKSVSNRLHQQGLIRAPLPFLISVKLAGLDKNIQAGTFNLSPNQSAIDIAHSLRQGQQDFTKVTLLEGWRREEMADELAARLSDPDSPFDKQAFLAETQNLEGYLFPDTYFIPKTATSGAVIKLLQDNFNSQLNQVDLSATTRPLDKILTLASIVEREARTKRPLIAGILLKRLQNDWPLQADATLQYIKGSDPRIDEWWPIPLASDKDLASPYNTYQNLGLPPSPIANPSLSSIQAATTPQESPYWFYLSDQNGNLHFATTLEEHNQNVNRYLR